MTTKIENVSEYLAPCVEVSDEKLEELAAEHPPVENANAKLLFAMARELRAHRQASDASAWQKPAEIPSEVAPVAPLEPEDEPKAKKAKSK